MTVAIITLAVVILAAAAILLIRLTAEDRRQEKLVLRVRETDLYSHIYGMLLQYNTPYLESVIIRQEGLIIRTMLPVGGEVRYTFASHGLDDPGDETLYALAQAIMVDMKILRNTRHYTFRCHSFIRPNGAKGEWYEYAVTPAWKGDLLRAEAKKHNEQLLKGETE